LDSLYLAQHRVEYYSDYGVVLVYLGRYEEAKAVFLAIEARQPGRYATAANLGTVYELLGHNEKALHWIQQAVRINPASHHGSEWIHVNILKAKIQGDQAINSQFLLGTDFGSAATPVATESLANVTKLRNALYFQLSERMGFIKPKDKIMGQLLFDLGNSYALTSDVESALEVYQVAKQYGYESSTLTNRRTYFTWLKHKDDLMGLLVLATALGTITFGMVKLVKRRRSRRIFS
jgi:tetratricopeptide (TPR) repeat protein